LDLCGCSKSAVFALFINPYKKAFQLRWRTDIYAARRPIRPISERAVPRHNV
jgi:hypothetical protein